MPSYSPTPDQIDERCLEIQKTWDEKTRRSRQAGLPKKDVPRGWPPPIVSVSELTAIIEDDLRNGG